jgi:hypothetical protein
MAELVAVEVRRVVGLQLVVVAVQGYGWPPKSSCI